MVKEKTRTLKKLLSFVLFCLLTLVITAVLSGICRPKAMNRFFMLSEYLEENPEKQQCEIKVFGSCHAYTSFDPILLREQTGLDSFVYANPCEIIPTTYARMVEQFKKHVPQVALVETWGIDPYDTYLEAEEILGEYLKSNLASMDFSLARERVIWDYIPHREIVETTFPFFLYRGRLINRSVKAVDFDYSFEQASELNSPGIQREIRSRLENDGFKRNLTGSVPEYRNWQSHIEAGETAELDPVILGYIQRIIELCRDNGVTLIFYRAPYLSSQNELRCCNTLRQLCEESGVLYVDLEREIEFDYTTDFFDYQHLSAAGAAKATALLGEYIAEAMK